MSDLTYPKTTEREKSKTQEHGFRGPSLPKVIADVKELTRELFMHPAEKPQFNAPVYRG